MNEVMYEESILKNEINLEIKDAKLDDTGAIKGFLVNLKDESRIFMALCEGLSLSYEGIYDYINSVVESKNDLGIVGRVDGEIIATARVVGDKKNICAHNGELFVLVRREYWGRGISKIMIANIVAKAKVRTKLKNIMSVLNVEDSPIIEAYEKMGFRKAGVYRNYYKVGSQFCHGIIMILNI